MKKQKNTSLPQPENLHNSSNILNNIWLWVIAIVVLCGIVFAPTLQHGFFIIDDDVYVNNNALLPYPSFQIFKTFVCQNYHPFTILSFVIDYSIAENDPSIYHKTNLLLHIFNSILVLLFCFRLFEKLLPAAFIALMFSLHPLHIESVAWISERKDLLYSCFYLLSLIGYLKYLNSKKLVYLGAALLLFICSLLSKSQAISLPFIFILLDYYYQRKDYKFIIIEKIPFLLLSVAFGYIALISQSEAINDFLSNANFWQRGLIICYSTMMYVVKLLLPFKLSMFYPYPNFNAIPVEFYFSPFVILGIIILLIKYRNQRLLNFGILFFIISLIPILQFKPFGAAIMAERYTYLASIGIFIPIVYYLQQYLASKWIYMISGYILILVLITHSRIDDWSASKTNLLQAEKNYPSVFVKNTLANLYGQNGKIDSGKYFIKAAMQQQPNLPMLYFSRAHFCEKNFTEGLNDIDTALSLHPKYVIAHIYKGLLYAQMGINDSAFACIRKGLSIKPNTDGYLLLAQLHEQNKQNDSALYYYKRAYENEPSNLVAYQKYFGINK